VTTSIGPRTPTSPVTWVVGSGGLLGGAVSRASAARIGDPLRTPRIHWSDPSMALAELRRSAVALLDGAERDGRPWQLAWCAGAGVTGSSRDDLAAEVGAMRVLLGAVAERLGRSPGLAEHGAVFVASSVGGVYGGTADPPFTEDHPVAPVSDYGRAKLDAETVAVAFARQSGVPTVIGRITNLYGPGQNLDKPQGLISHLCKAHLTRSSVSVYVSLDTIRDYLFVDDAAALVLDALDRVRRHPGESPDADAVVKILGAHQGVTIGALLGEFRRVFKRSPLVLVGGSELARHQARDLRVRSIVWPELDARPLTCLPAGLAATAEHLYRTVKGAG